MLTTAEAAALLSERGVTVNGHPPTARTVEAWCRAERLPSILVGGRVRQIAQADLDAFVPPVMGRPVAQP